MKSTGIVRKVDELGRVVLPIELRRSLDIEEKDALEIYVDGNSVILKKYEPEKPIEEIKTQKVINNDLDKKLKEVMKAFVEQFLKVNAEG